MLVITPNRGILVYKLRDKPNKMNKTINMGNNESLGYGVFKNSDGTYTAMTLTRSAEYKTEKGATNWMNKNMPNWKEKCS